MKIISVNLSKWEKFISYYKPFQEKHTVIINLFTLFYQIKQNFIEEKTKSNNFSLFLKALCILKNN